MRAVAAATLVACLATASPADGQWPDVGGDVELVDLTHPFDAAAVYWPTAEPFRLEVVSEGMSDAGWYAAKSFCAAEHGGTHLDAPVHFAEGGRTAAELPVEDLVGDAVVVDVTTKTTADRDYLIGVDDLESWEAAHGPIPQRAIVLLRTGWGDRWPDRERYLGTAARGPAAVSDLRFPGLSEGAARWLVDRDIRAVGIDTASIDRGQSTDFRAHRVLAAAETPIFENVAELDRVVVRGAWVVALPMKIAGGTGGPLRIIAFQPRFLPEGPDE